MINSRLDVHVSEVSPKLGLVTLQESLEEEAERDYALFVTRDRVKTKPVAQVERTEGEVHGAGVVIQVTKRSC